MVEDICMGAFFMDNMVGEGANQVTNMARAFDNSHIPSHGIIPLDRKSFINFKVLQRHTGSKMWLISHFD